MPCHSEKNLYNNPPNGYYDLSPKKEKTMPCKSDHMEPNSRENESVRVLTLLKELGDEFVLKPRGEIGVYGDVSNLDEDTAELCKICTQIEEMPSHVHDIRNFSLELQIWWRDHKAFDEARKKKEEGLNKLVAGLLKMDPTIEGVIEYIENDAEIAIPIGLMFDEDGNTLTKDAYGKVLLEILCNELRNRFINK